MEDKTRRIVLLIIGIPLIIAGIIWFFDIPTSLDDPKICNRCHEMRPYVASFLNPENGSVIAEHNLNCLGCHRNTTLNEARSAVLREIEASILTNITGIQMKTSFSALNVNCKRCHVMKDSQHVIITNNTSCLDCHWAHRSRESIKAVSAAIPFGPHRNQTCQNCHGTTFEIPRCIKCHTGHGGQKLENGLCLGCHINPHVPEKPGSDTGNFPQNLPFSVCQPCHENEYYNMTNLPSMHTNMQTCTLCHKFHGEIPKCNFCHPGMMNERHTTFNCRDCHIAYNPVKITCEDCHGRSHEWSAATAILNPK